MEADITSQAVGLASNTDFSLVSLFLRADIIVKSVMIILVVFSIYSWAIIFDKIRLFRKINKSAEEFEEKFWKSKSAETFYNNLPSTTNDPMAELFKSSMQMVMKSRSKSNLSERLAGVLEANIEKQMTNVDKNYTFLATVGSTAPFIGLFGTVWGIMSSFMSLSGSNQATIAMVAPGISEALIATAFGLFAAIPAVIAFNRFTHKLDLLAGQMENFGDDCIKILHREIHLES